MTIFRNGVWLFLLIAFAFSGAIGGVIHATGAMERQLLFTGLAFIYMCGPAIAALGTHVRQGEDEIQAGAVDPASRFHDERDETVNCRRLAEAADSRRPLDALHLVSPSPVEVRVVDARRAHRHLDDQVLGLEGAPPGSANVRPASASDLGTKQRVAQAGAGAAAQQEELYCGGPVRARLAAPVAQVAVRGEGVHRRAARPPADPRLTPETQRRRRQRNL